MSALDESTDHTPAGVKHDEEKPRWDLLPFRPVREVVKVLTFGSQKYEDNNWKHVEGARRRYIAAALRHITDWAEGERNDPETGYNHLAHATCCLLFLLWFDQREEQDATRQLANAVEITPEMIARMTAPRA